ncbi:phosphotransferase [Halobacteriovorax sp. JY17]|uniref:phosphotransferase n=1 Tax=Halobacteriovorax sp. JY17 TaxID=2014617 RepID=UPI000C54073E|nr:phosphotransferase [Halobacteriovorax sp. JY17]PIK14008.1 MAG: hypothetical protein CES88_13575 [Halobacteriovorax sp. JY17]
MDKSLKLKTEEIKKFLKESLDNIGFDSIKRECVDSFQHEAEFIYLLNGKDVVGQYFLRAYKGNFSWWTIFGDLPKREEVSIKYLKDLGVPCPDVIAIGVINNISVILTQKVNAITLKGNLDETNIYKLAFELGSLHRKSLANPIESAHLPDVSIDKLFELMSEWSIETKDQRVIDAVKITKDRINLKCRKVSFLHGDLNVGNILLEKEQLLFIDFEESVIGSPMIDVATFCEQLRRYKKTELIKLFIKKYEESSGYNVDELESWMKIMDLRDLVTGALIKSRLKEGLQLPLFNHDAWIKYGDKVLKSYSV